MDLGRGLTQNHLPFVVFETGFFEASAVIVASVGDAQTKGYLIAVAASFCDFSKDFCYLSYALW